MPFLAREKIESSLITVWGDSMLPTLKAYWKIRVMPAEPQRIKIGDIVISVNRTLICHRIIGKWGERKRIYFLQKGDNSVKLEKMPADAVLGKVVEVRNEKFERIEDNQWKPQSTVFLFYSYSVCFFYKLLLIFKKLIFGNKRNSLTTFISRLYWTVSFSVIPFIQRKVDLIKSTKKGEGQ